MRRRTRKVVVARWKWKRGLLRADKERLASELEEARVAEVAGATDYLVYKRAILWDSRKAFPRKPGYPDITPDERRAHALRVGRAHGCFVQGLRTTGIAAIDAAKEVRDAKS